MCVNNPIAFHSDKPIIAYKMMLAVDGKVQSYVADNIYELGKEYDAGEPSVRAYITWSNEYNVGFHAYEDIEGAKRNADGWNCVVVKVELSDLTFKGTEESDRIFVVYVANKCKFLEIVEM